MSLTEGKPLLLGSFEGRPLSDLFAMSMSGSMALHEGATVATETLDFETFRDLMEFMRQAHVRGQRMAFSSITITLDRFLLTYARLP